MTIAQVQGDISANVSSVRCAVCDHDMDAHDAIGRRYCEATTHAQALGRNCICRPA
jgi:hypothetical protein